MKRRHFWKFPIGLFIGLFASLPTACVKSDDRSPAVTAAPLTVSAAISLREPLQKIEQLYRQNQANAQITYNFGASGSLQQQIEQGAPVDIFISASPKQMDALQRKNLIRTETRKDLVANQVALITPKHNSAVKITTLADLTRPEVKRIALGEPKSVPAGQYAAEALNYYQISAQVTSKAVYGKDVRQVLTYVETGNVDAGFVYITDARSSDRVTVVATIPAQAHSKIVYPIAVLQRSNNPTAQNFANFLASTPAKDVFRQYGFSTPEP
jgi:molybdate transport system substrate-binding protein